MNGPFNVIWRCGRGILDRLPIFLCVPKNTVLHNSTKWIPAHTTMVKLAILGWTPCQDRWTPLWRYPPDLSVYLSATPAITMGSTPVCYSGPNLPPASRKRCSTLDLCSWWSAVSMHFIPLWSGILLLDISELSNIFKNLTSCSGFTQEDSINSHMKSGGTILHHRHQHSQYAKQDTRCWWSHLGPGRRYHRKLRPGGKFRLLQRHNSTS